MEISSADLAEGFANTENWLTHMLFTLDRFSLTDFLKCKFENLKKNFRATFFFNILILTIKQRNNVKHLRRCTSSFYIFYLL